MFTHPFFWLLWDLALIILVVRRIVPEKQWRGYRIGWMGLFGCLYILLPFSIYLIVVTPHGMPPFPRGTIGRFGNYIPGDRWAWWAYGNSVLIGALVAFLLFINVLEIVAEKYVGWFAHGGAIAVSNTETIDSDIYR